MLATSCDFRCWLVIYVPLPLLLSILQRNHGDLAAQALKQLQCTAEAGREEPVGEGGAVPEAGLVEVGGEEGEDFGIPKDLGGGVGVCETVGGEQGEGAEGTDLDLEWTGVCFQQQRGQGVRTGRRIQASQRAESGERFQRQGGESQEAVVPGSLAGAACLPGEMCEDGLHGIVSCGRLVQSGLRSLDLEVWTQDSMLSRLSRKRG